MPFTDKFSFFSTTAVYDGHSGIAAARYLEKHLYNVFSKSLDMHSLGLDSKLESDDEGLCCPLELHDVLTECYRRSDDALLKWLKSKHLSTPTSINNVYYYYAFYWGSLFTINLLFHPFQN